MKKHRTVFRSSKGPKLYLKGKGISFYEKLKLYLKEARKKGK